MTTPLIGNELVLFQSQCNMKTGDCRISRKQVNIDNEIATAVEKIECINATDCIITDIFMDKYFFWNTKMIMYVCEKNLSIEPNNSVDYLIFRAIDYTTPIEIRDKFSLNLNFLGNLTILDQHVKEYKKLL